jgi:hypothetical protein
MPAETYLEILLREFSRLKQLGDRAIAQTRNEHLFAALHPNDNSMALIIKHISGNLVSRWRDFLTTDGEKHRDRDAEFLLTGEDTRETLLARWEEGWRTLFHALTPLKPEDLERTVTIRSEPHTAMQAVNRQLTHYAYHVGQLVFLAKHFAGDGWNTLSIPRGQSEAVSRKAGSYLAGSPLPKDVPH